jgi:hypothetical protein
MVKQISVFEAQEIGGKIVPPLCEPVDNETISTSVAAATNLIWFAMNIAVAKGDRMEAGKLARMVEAIAEIEVEDIPGASESEDFNEMMDRLNEALEAGDDEPNEDSLPD